MYFFHTLLILVHIVFNSSYTSSIPEGYPVVGEEQ